VERCRVLIHLVDISDKEPAEAMRIVERELEAYGEGLDEKPRLIALNKVDLADAELVEGFAAELVAAGAARVFPVRGPTRQGIPALLDAVLDYLPARTSTENPGHGVVEAADDGEEPEVKPWSPL